MLDRALAYSCDRALMMRDAGMPPDDWQARLLRSKARRELVLASRQTGKSLTGAFLALSTAILSPPSLTLLLSPSLRQSSELFRRVAENYHPFADLAPLEAESALRLELRNGSRIVSLPGTETTIRGFSNVALLIVDEGSRVPDELYSAVRPFLAVSDGRLLALSTPFGQRGWFWNEWTSGEGWERTAVPATECKRISAAFLEEEARVLGHWTFEQEYGLKFFSPEGSYFDPLKVRAALSDDVRPLFEEDVCLL